MYSLEAFLEYVNKRCCGEEATSHVIGKLGPDPTVVAEVRFGVYILAVSIGVFGQLLGAFKSTHEDKYRSKDTPKVAVFDEKAIYAEAGGEEEGAFEISVLELLEQVPAMPPMQEQIVTIDDDSKKHYQQGGGQVPQFMAVFLENMKTAGEAYRQDKVRTLRTICTQLRTVTLLHMAGTLFADLFARGTGSLERRTGDAEMRVRAILRDTDERRKANEKALTPSMANPNYAKQLKKLCDEDTERYEFAKKTIAEARVEMAALFRAEAGHTTKRFAATFEALIHLVDRIPLTPHFRQLDGDDTVEYSRMSLKRLLRKQSAGHEGIVDQSGEVLPSRTWECLEGACLQLSPEWDEDGADAPELDLGAFSPVDSVRSPVHKALFHERNRQFTRYCECYAVTSQRRLDAFKAAMTKEQLGERNWQTMLVQLTKGEVSQQ